MTLPLFPDDARETLDPGACLLRGFALEQAPTLLHAIHTLTTHAPLRHLITPGGQRMSVAMSNCGALGWVSDKRGYRYTPCDPDSGAPWPAMPSAFSALATQAAAAAGYADFEPDACLINRYASGTRLSLHQDRNERDMTQPIVSVSLGVTARFVWGGAERNDKTRRLTLEHGDVVVWGGPARLRFHGVLPLAHGTHPLTGACRINLTFRKAR